MRQLNDKVERLERQPDLRPSDVNTPLKNTLENENNEHSQPEPKEKAAEGEGTEDTVERSLRAHVSTTRAALQATNTLAPTQTTGGW